MITRETVRRQIEAYLNGQLTLADLVAWSEDVVMDAEIPEPDIEIVTKVAARIGVADVQEFGLSWEDIHDMLAQLGYGMKVSVISA